MDKPLLAQFFERRQRLIAELQEGARRVNAWWAEREESEPTLQDLAALEGMLAERKRLLEQMMKLDDDMLGELVMARVRQQNNEAVNS